MGSLLNFIVAFFALLFLATREPNKRRERTRREQEGEEEEARASVRANSTDFIAFSCQDFQYNVSAPMKCELQDSHATRRKSRNPPSYELHFILNPRFTTTFRKSTFALTRQKLYYRIPSIVSTSPRPDRSMIQKPYELQTYTFAVLLFCRAAGNSGRNNCQEVRVEKIVLNVFSESLIGLRKIKSPYETMKTIIDWIFTSDRIWIREFWIFINGQAFFSHWICASKIESGMPGSCEIYARVR